MCSRDVDELGEEEADLEDLEDGEHPPVTANAYFAANHRKLSVGQRSSKYAKRSFADLPGGRPQELTDAVQALLERPVALNPTLREHFAPRYAGWLSMLHAGFSLLLHGFGSKKELIEDFAAGINRPDSPVVVLHGYSSGARVRDLLESLLSQVLKVAQAPNGSTRALCKQVRQEFAASAPPPPVAAAGGAEQLLLRLLPAPAKPDGPPSLAACVGALPSSPMLPPTARPPTPVTTAPGAMAAVAAAPAATAAATATAATSVAVSFSGESGKVALLQAATSASSVARAPPRLSPRSGGAARNVGLAGDEEETEEATAEAQTAARSEALFSPQGATKRERRVLRQLADSEHYAGAAMSTTGRLQAGSGRLLATGFTPDFLSAERHVRKRALVLSVASNVADSSGSPFEPSPLAPANERAAARHMSLRARPSQQMADENGLGFVNAAGRVGLAPATAGASTARLSHGSRVPAHVYVVVHAIDSAGLRGEESQALLAELARIPQIHLIASCSHRNTAVLWDARKARALNWAWVEAATGASYAHESADSIHELLGCLYESAVGTEGRSAQLVLGQLTNNACELFQLLIGHQLDNPRAAGLSFAELYQKARPLFLATSESALRKHINEFTTHELVRIRSGPGGQQVYWCHFPGETLKALREGSGPNA